MERNILADNILRFLLLFLSSVIACLFITTKSLPKTVIVRILIVIPLVYVGVYTLLFFLFAYYEKPKNLYGEFPMFFFRIIVATIIASITASIIGMIGVTYFVIISIILPIIFYFLLSAGKSMEEVITESFGTE